MIHSTPVIGALVELIEDYGMRPEGSQGIVTHLEPAKANDGSLVHVKLNGGGVIVCFERRLKTIVNHPRANVPQARRELIEIVKATSVRVGTRNVDAIFKSLVEEVGELATELSIEAGTKKREASPDGVVGEAIDVLVVILDLLHLKLGDDISGQAFLDRVQSKLNKWEGK